MLEIRKKIKSNIILVPFIYNFSIIIKTFYEFLDINTLPPHTIIDASLSGMQ